MRALIVAAALTLVISGCAAADGTGRPRSRGGAIGSLGPGFIDATAPPAPESMIRPRPGSWEAIRPPRDYRVVLLVAADDLETAALATEVKVWAEAQNVRLETVTATAPERFVDAIVAAIERSPDLVICTGRSLVDALALVTASHLDQQFLILGAQLPEPTVNVTAAVWRGASSRGSEIDDARVSFGAGTFAPRLVGDALRAGVASVLSGITGIVIWLE